jgi:hypothetical protein
MKIFYKLKNGLNCGVLAARSKVRINHTYIKGFEKKNPHHQGKLKEGWR